MEQFRYISFINSRLSFNKYVFTRQNFIGKKNKQTAKDKVLKLLLMQSVRLFYNLRQKF